MRAGTLLSLIVPPFHLAIVLVALTTPLQAGSPGSPDDLLERVQITEKGSSGKSERNEATQQLPWKHMTADKQQVVRNIVNSSDLFRRMPTRTFEVNPAVYRYFTVHPDVAVSIWRALQVSKYRLE